MELKSIRALRGPNLWADCTVLVAQVRIEQGRLPEVARLASSSVADCLGPWSETEASALGVARVWAKLAVRLQSLIGTSVELAEAHTTLDPTDYRLVVEYREEGVGRAAVHMALSWLSSLADARPFDLDAELATLRKLDQNQRLGPSTGSIVQAAVRRGIPVRRLNDGSLVQFGHGARQRRIWASETDRTGAIAEAIAQDKELTKSLLAAVGVPVPEGRTPASAEEAWQAALEIGLPVVVKPSDGNQGRGVSVGLDTEEAVKAAFRVALREGRAVLVERHLCGFDYRLLVVGECLVAAARREVPKVVGDGQSSVAELVRVTNQDPRRGEDHATAQSKLLLDEIACEVLGTQALTPESVPAPGQVVVLRRNANLSTGGSAIDVTDEVHPEVAARAIQAARMVGLDVAGIDVVAPSLDRPLEETGGAIVEVNAAPGLRMHLEPSEGQPRPVGEAIVDLLFPGGKTGRIPIVNVTGTNGKTTTVRFITHLLKGHGFKVGMTCTDGIYIDQHRVDTGDCSGPKSARAVLSHPQVDAAVLETARGGILREGLGFDWCDVTVVTNIAEGDHLGMAGVETAEQLALVKQTTVRRVSPQGAAVLNASDPLVVAMAQHCRGAVVYFARSPGNPVLVAHRRVGGRAVFVEGGWICVAVGHQEWRVAPLERVPLTQGGRIGFQIDNALASVAAVWFLGVPLEVIRGKLDGFVSDVQTVPGRFNVLHSNGSTVILDYGHNASALFALLEAIDNMPHTRRSIVYTAAGDRRDRDIIQQAIIIGNGFDQVFLYEDKCTRGRPDGEVIRLMQEGLRRTRRVAKIHQTRGEFAAIQSALQRLEPGDLLLCQVDQVEQALEFVQARLAAVIKRRMARREAKNLQPLRSSPAPHSLSARASEVVLPFQVRPAW
jgi:cyanophycin synthetase